MDGVSSGKDGLSVGFDFGSSESYTQEIPLLICFVFLMSKYEEKNIKEKFNFANKQYFLCRLHLKLSNVCISKAGTIPNIIIFLHVIPTNKGDSNSCIHTFFYSIA